MKKVCIVLTTRGNYAKFKKFIELCEKEPEIDLQIVVGGELLLTDHVVDLFKMNIISDYEVYFNVAGDNLLAMGKSLANAVAEFSTAFARLNPDLVMLVGDRFETFAASMAAFVLEIPIAHLEGGEISGTLDDRFRACISQMSTIHFPCTIAAAHDLLGNGHQYVHNVGSTSIDAILEAPILADKEFIEFQEKYGAGKIINPVNRYLLIIYHPDTVDYENIEPDLQELILAINELKIPSYWINANMDAGSGKIGAAIRQYRNQENPNFIHFFKSLPIEVFGYLLKEASCIVGNASVGIREATYFGIPNVCIGERQDEREVGRNTLFCPPSKNKIMEAIKFQMQHGSYGEDNLYGDGHASEKIIEIIKR